MEFHPDGSTNVFHIVRLLSLYYQHSYSWYYCATWKYGKSGVQLSSLEILDHMPQITLWIQMLVYGTAEINKLSRSLA